MHCGLEELAFSQNSCSVCAGPAFSAGVTCYCGMNHFVRNYQLCLQQTSLVVELIAYSPTRAKNYHSTEQVSNVQ